MALLDVLIGRPLASGEQSNEKIGVATGIPIFGLDALSSAAYGPEACLTLLIPLGLPGVHHIVPLSLAIVALLVIVFFSYRQTIHAYPGGGGSYTVAKENLGEGPGLLAAAALMIDYILVAAVGISAGVGALVSAVPALHPYMLPMCLVILLLITIINLRGVKDTGGAFMYPTYLFAGTILMLIAIGGWKVLSAGGAAPVPVTPPPIAPVAVESASLWLLVRAFASGCTALTGVEAVSNGVQAFRDNKDAQRTLTAIIGLLVVMLAGIAWLVSAYGIVATDPESKDYESVLSLLLGAVVGKGIFYYVSIVGILLVLCLSANTAFADFPRLCRIVALDDYLPHSLSARGRRLVFTEGIWVLAFFAALLLVLFGGVTDRLIPLFAIGAFLAFTLSQAGMVAHWRKLRGPGSMQSMLVNGLGALTTGITVLVVLVAKFAEGAWITLLLIPLILWLMHAVKRHYERVDHEMTDETALNCSEFASPLAIVPIESLEPDFEAGGGLRAFHFEGCEGPAYQLRERPLRHPRGMGGVRQETGAESGAAGAGADRARVAVPADRDADCRTDPADREGQCGAADYGDHPGAGTAALVLLFPPQHAIGDAEDAVVFARESADCGRQCAVVSGVRRGKLVAMHRREFLAGMAATLAAPAAESSAEKPLPMGLNTYCLRAMKWHDLELIDYTAGLKLDGIFLQDSLDPDVMQPEHWAKVRAYAKAHGLQRLETGGATILPKTPDGFDAQVKALAVNITRAKGLGSPIVRCLFAGERATMPQFPLEQNLEMAVRVLRAVRTQAMDAGIKLAIENHKDVQAFETRRVIETAGKEFVGSYLDTGNPVFVLEDPMTTVEELGPFAVCVHLRDSVIYEHPRGVAVQWVPLGEGVVDFRKIVAKVREICPPVYIYIKPITGRPPAVLPYLEESFWTANVTERGRDLARFIALAKKGRPYELPMVIEDIPGRKTPEAFVAAVQYQQREHMERSVEYGKKVLGLGIRWRTS